MLSWRDRIETSTRRRLLSALSLITFQYGIRTCIKGARSEGSQRYDHVFSICPVAKAAEVFGDRWSPIIIRELCFGTRSFGQLLEAAPPISRTVLAQRLKQLEQFGVVHIEPKPSGKGHLYRLTPAGEDFRSIIELLSEWGQRWGQGLVGPDDLDPQALVWSMRRQIDPTEIPAQGSLSALISVVCPNPIAVRATGG